MDIFYLSIFTSVMLILFGVFFIFNGIRAISRQKIGFPLIGSFKTIGFANVDGKSARYLGILFTVLGIVIIFSAIQFYFFINSDTAVPFLGCTQEAKICPDGSTVGRTGPDCEFAECPTVKADETADWQTYRNDKYGFEIKYPRDWFAFWYEWTMGGPLYHKEGIDQHYEEIILASKDIKSFEDINNSNWLEISRETGAAWVENSNNVDDFWNKLGKTDEQTGELVNKFIEKKTISGVDFIFFEQYNWSVKFQKKVWSPQALFMYKGNFFWVRGGDTIEKTLFDQILSNFKFIE